MNTTERIRHPAVAGKFYPANAKQLREMVCNLLDKAESEPPGGDIRGIVSPHAGYMYSGLTAAHAYKLLRGKDYPTVIIVSPSHFDYFHGVSVYPGSAYETPLGKVQINAGLRESLLAASDAVMVSEAGHRAEHALEVQLPFLQVVLTPGMFTLVPLVIGDQKRETCFALGRALGDVLERQNVLLVASTDLSHYYPASAADRLDEVMMKDVASFDYDRLMTDLETRRTEACGGGPTVAVMVALDRLGVKKMKVTHRSNSGDTTGDYSSVVGYLSAVAYV